MKKKCPRCRKMYSVNKDSNHRPFCSEKCQAIDLGDWFFEKHKISRPIIAVSYTHLRAHETS